MQHSTPQAAAAARAQEFKTRQIENVILSLETERNGYVMRGLTERVEAVDEQIALRRAQLEATVVDEAPEQEPPADDPPAVKGRGSAKAAAEAAALEAAAGGSES